MLSEEDFKQIYTVELETDQIDEWIEWCSIDEIFSEIAEELQDYKTRYEEVSDELALEIAEKLQSNVQEWISTNGSIATGLMFHSVDVVEQGTRSVLVEETAVSDEGTFYPAIIEEGRGPIIASEGSVLAFYPTGGFGELVFAKSAKGVPAKPFWEPAVIQTEGELELIVEQKLMEV